MKGEVNMLPSGFEYLAPFVEEWGGLDTQDQRYRRRQSLPMPRLQAFYDVVSPRLDEIFVHLDRFAFGEDLPPAEKLLLKVVMGMSEVAQAVEMYGQPRVPNSPENHSVKMRGLSCA